MEIYLNPKKSGNNRLEKDNLLKGLSLNQDCWNWKSWRSFAYIASLSKNLIALQGAFDVLKPNQKHQRDSFEENDENETPDSETQITKKVDFNDALKKDEIIKNRNKDEEKKSPGFESIFKKKQKSTSKKDSFVEGENSSDEEKEQDVNIEMKKFWFIRLNNTKIFKGN